MIIKSTFYRFTSYSLICIIYQIFLFLQLSLRKNSLLRMYGVSRLHNLRVLNLSYNAIIGIEALKECIHLTHLNLEGNQIKTIEHLNTNLKLEYLNLGENSIGVVNDISFLKHLKVRYHIHLVK